jgi:flagellar basal-body rod protein FlgB
LVKPIEGEAPMFPKLEVTRMAQALAAHAGARQGVVAANIAQADTPGYRARDLPSFAEVWQDGASSGLVATRSGHLSGSSGSSGATARQTTDAASPDGNSVSLEREMVRAAEVRTQHDMALSVYRSVSDVIRASLGRAR